ncbi:HDOD domain-containing protein [Reinekea sp. G2M2-21]|uniref:HDOD domain-containing protein n=1 Tax=Reinekea sp. G2M2-21 TaxID=2788942 RepID=UPI00351C3A1C
MSQRKLTYELIISYAEHRTQRLLHFYPVHLNDNEPTMSIELDSEQIEQILQGISIPPQPQIMVDLQMEQFQPTPDLGRIADLIAQDVGLAGTMLKIVNSPAYGLANNITSVTQAVMLLGIKSVVNIINGISIRGELSDEDIVRLNNFWDASMDIASVSLHIAKQIGMPAPEDAYSLGLFHNAGIVLMNKRFPDYMDIMQSAYSGEFERIIDAENRHFRTNHAVIGYYTARSWRLPKIICEAISEHHNIASLFSRDSVSEAPKKTLLAVLKIAEFICGNAKVLGRCDEDFEWHQIKRYIYEFTGLGEYDIEALIDDFKEMGIASVITNH